MAAVTAPRTASRHHRLLLAVLLVLSLLWQPWVSTAHAVAMASGTEVCTSTGPQVFDANGKAIDAQPRSCLDCCGAMSPPALLPTAAALALHPLSHAAPAEPLTAQRLAAQWLVPLSRGPPVLS
jgi:hypothetical protein